MSDMTLSKRYDVCRLLGYDTVWSGTLSTDVLVERVHKRVLPKRWYTFSQLLSDASRKVANPHLQFIEPVTISRHTDLK
jgi:uridine kinase